MKIICVSDTHTYQNRMIHPIPDGDVIIHAGDFMSSGYNKFEYIPFLSWFNDLPHTHKILIAGNHDRYVQMCNEDFLSDVNSFKNINYLQDESIIIENVKFYGSPWTKYFYSWAFNFPNHNYYPDRAKEVAKACWAQIPDDTNVLITHGQPFGVHDRAPDGCDTGCPELSRRIEELADLMLYVGGHIHCRHGAKKINEVTFVNASICDEDYCPVNAPIEIIL